MGFFSFLDPALNFVFGPLLNLPPFWSILIISFIISVIIVLVYKFCTNQKVMKELKDETKALQKQMKELKDNPSKAMEVQKKAMQTNMQYMMKSMKPTLITFIPIILIFGWLQAHLAFVPILPDQDFSMTIEFDKGVSGNIIAEVPSGIELSGPSSKEISDSKVVFTMRGKEGVYKSPPVEFTVDSKTYSKPVIITSEPEYVQPFLSVKDGIVKSITTSNEKMKILNIFGWKLGWLGTYIILAIVFSMILRKLLRVY
ncbi:DUF106 domain-containing protein [Candidatus Woesearchaeota archaeon]|nr:DUF106 domain-containing protein [Candidatus Woesearchaeota archaeon]